MQNHRALVIAAGCNMVLAPTKSRSGATDGGSRLEARALSSTLNKYDGRSVSTCNLREHDNVRLTSRAPAFCYYAKIPAVKIGTAHRVI